MVTPRLYIWIAVVVVIAAAAIYLLMPHDKASGPGQPPPHAIKQSR
jgi:hypothetical protein